MVETGGLENRCTGNRTGGSNPSLSATFLRLALIGCDGYRISVSRRKVAQVFFRRGDCVPAAPPMTSSLAGAPLPRSVRSGALRSARACERGKACGVIMPS